MKKNFRIAIFFAGALACLKVQAQQSFILQSGTTLTSSGGMLVLENMNLKTDGSFNESNFNGKTIFSGALANSISGSSTPLFNDLAIAKGTAELKLLTNINVWGIFSFTSGLLNLNNQVMDLAKFGSLSGESESSHAIGPNGGYIQWSDVLNAPSNLNPGNLGMHISSTVNLGNTIVRRGHQSQTNGSGGGSSILRYFDIIPTNNNNVNGTLRLDYFDAELNGLAEPSLGLIKSVSLPNWTYIGYDSKDAALNYVTKGSLSDFSRWTLSTPANPVPVYFSAFQTTCKNGLTSLHWVTQTEINTYKFRVEKSVNRITWATIGTVAAAGNSNTVRDYQFIDPAAGSIAYYRIVETDRDGRDIQSPVAMAECDASDNSIRYWPNPVKELLWIDLQSSADALAQIQVFDSKGSLVYLGNQPIVRGVNLFALKMLNLPSGQYQVRLSTQKALKQFGIIKL